MWLYMNNNVYVYFDTTIDTTFRSQTLVPTRTMYHFDTPLGTTPLTTSVDRLTFLAFVECITSYLTIRLGTSPRPPGHLYISCGCVVCSGVVV